MSIFSEIVSAATGGLGPSIVSAIQKYFPPDMSPAEKAAIALEADKIQLQRENAAITAQIDAEKALTDRIASLEGTASDLKAVPYIGPLLILARGAQRPVWGFATLYLDYGVFSGLWKLTDPVVANAFWVVNFLVLGFLFGERALMNILPALSTLTAARNAKPNA